MRLVKSLLAALIFSLATYLLLLGAEGRAEFLAAAGIKLKHSTAMVMSIQFLALGVILGVKAIFDRTPMRTR